MRVLIVEDDPVTAVTLKNTFESDHHVVETVDNGEDALEHTKIFNYDIVVLDQNLPDMTGNEVLHRLRIAQRDTPVIVLTSSQDNDQKLRAFDIGADDYVSKPYWRDELKARAMAIVRRNRGHSASRITTGRLTVDLSRRSVEIDGKPINVTAKEYSILELLSLRKGVPLTKGMFLDHLYGGMDEPEQKIVDVFICKLRKKIASITKSDHGIETVWGQGYRLRDPDQTAQGLNEGSRKFLTPDEELALAFEEEDGLTDQPISRMGSHTPSQLELLLLELFPKN